MTKRKIYYVADEITDMGNKAFFKLKDARKYCYDLVDDYRNKMQTNPYMTEDDKNAPIIQDDKYGLSYSVYHGRKAEINIAYIDIE